MRYVVLLSKLFQAPSLRHVHTLTVHTLTALAICILGGTPALAQAPPDTVDHPETVETPETVDHPETVETPEDEGVGDFFDTVDVEIVNIDVWVTDTEGKPVTGLDRDDFVVYRDGEPVEIANFYAVEDGLSTRRPAASGSDDPPTSDAPKSRGDLVLEELTRETMVVDEKLPDEHQLWLIIYIDNFNIDPTDRNRILPQVRRFIGRSLRPGDNAMVVTYSRGLKVVQPFTDQVDDLYAALDSVEDDAGLAVIRQRERYDALQRMDRDSTPDQGMMLARNYAEEMMSNVEYTVDALQRLIDTLGGLPGRKALLHVSSGVPMLAGEELFQALGLKWSASEAYAEIPRHDTTRSWERVNRHANAQRVVFHTLDAGGLRGSIFGAAEYSSFVNPRTRSMLDSVVPQNLQSSLRLMALETGGQAILNRNDAFTALVEVAQDFRTFYSLGITSTGSDSGSYHEIEVELREKQKGVKVRHRSGYRSKDMPTRMKESLRSALLYEHQSNPHGIEVRWGRQSAETKKTYLVPIQLRIPLQDLVILPLRDKHELSLELYVGAVGEDGEVSEIDRAPIGLRLAPEHVEAARKESFLYTHKLLLSPGRKKIGVAILDTFGRESSIVTRYIDIGPGG